MQLYNSDRSAVGKRREFVHGTVPAVVYELLLAAVYADTTGIVRGVEIDRYTIRGG